MSEAVSAPVPEETVPTVPKDLPAVSPRLRLWPAVLIVVLEQLCLFVPGYVAPGTMGHFIAMFYGPIIGTLGLLVWWLAFSRAPWRDRWVLLAACLTIGTAAFLLGHSSIGGFFYLLWAIPAISAISVLWLLASSLLNWPARRAGLIAVFLLVFGTITLLRLDGADGSLAISLSWRWSPTAEDRFLAESAKASASTAPVKTLQVQPGDWPEFRGPKRNNRLEGVRIATNWDERKPAELWRRRIGPGWSSFAVVGEYAFTQEQRGPEEVVVCYATATGDEVWSHTDSERFTEVIAGPGPRATPTFLEGRLYSLGGKGRLNCLDAETGKPVWSRDIAGDSGASVPEWGFASSPLVHQGIVTVFAGGPKDKSVLGYDAESGKLVWSSGKAKFSYCSLQRATVDGVDQLLLTSELGLTAFDPKTGRVLWQFDWPIEGGMSRVVQPLQVGERDFLVGTSFGYGTKRVSVAQKEAGWQPVEQWTTRAIKPYYNDYVAHEKHLYGFDGPFLTCVSLENGKAKWKVRGYGNGQVLLLSEQNVLLVLSEQGEAALVEANPGRHHQLAKFQAIAGKTWNHPVVAHGKLFVRNGEEAACFDVSAE